MHLRSHRRRRGATLVEGVLIFLTFLTLILGMLDLGIAVLRYHMVSYLARDGARKASVHGTLAATPWDAATAQSKLEDGVNTAAYGLDSVTFTVTFPDGGSAPEQRVRVQAVTTYKPVTLFLFGNVTINLSATSTAQITH